MLLNMMETLEATTRRPLYFTARNRVNGKWVTYGIPEQHPAGTLVRVRENRRGQLIATIPGTIKDREVSVDDIDPDGV